jgi:glycosyltransferase involved in cell wall biosynthesis
MNILLVGEFSRLHNSLKEGLQELGHDVVIIGFGDGFKNYPVDYPLQRKFDSFIFRKFKAGTYKLTGFSIDSWFTYRQFKKMRSQFTGFDVVQFINENSFYCTYTYEKKILRFLFENNKKAFLMCCGSDYLSVKYAFGHPEFKSVVQPYLAGKISDKNFANVLKFRRNDYTKLHEYIYENIVAIIASDMDYHIPLQRIPKYAGMIPNPINVKKLQIQPLPSIEKVVIFHGINTENYFKKGNDYFEKALEVIKKKYGDSVEIITTRSIPYKQYIDLYNKAHIVLDMAYANDQGFNALEAMAKGKVVFTGAEKEFAAFYNLKEKVCINAIADVNYLVSELSALIENPIEIEAISKRARDFVENEHNYIESAKKYLNIWNR